MTGTPMTPDEFRLQMKEIRDNAEAGSDDRRIPRCRGKSRLNCRRPYVDILEKLGYGQGVELFQNMYKWYS